jgi:hypothetical protein
VDRVNTIQSTSSYRERRGGEMDSKIASTILCILLPARIAVILLYRPFTKRFLYGDTDQSTAKAQEAPGPTLIRMYGVPQDWTEGNHLIFCLLQKGLLNTRL